MTQFRTVGPSIERTPVVSAPAARSRPIAPAGKSAPQRATTPTARVHVSAAAAACTVLPPSVPIWLLPSAWITSSMVGLPMMPAGGGPGAAALASAGLTGHSLVLGGQTCALLRGDFL